MRRSLNVISMVTLALFVATCGDDPAKPGGPGSPHTSLSGHLTVVYDSVAVVGARVALVAAFPYRVVDGPVTTDTDGFFRFDNPPAGDWYLFVFADSVFMFDTDNARVSVRRGAHIARDIEMVRSELWGKTGRLITGRVTDARTGRPIAGAYVSGWMGSVYHNFVGITIDVETLTDADGRYAVAPINIFLYPPSRVSHPLGVSKEGYAPFYTMSVPVPEDPDSIYVLDVALERLGGGATARGRIVDTNGRALANLPVALDFVGIPLDSLFGGAIPAGGDDGSNVPLLGATLRTDSKGFFVFRDLTPGTYFVDAGFLPDDGYVGGWDEAGVFEVTGPSAIDLGDIYVLPALVPLSPANGAVVHDPRPVVRWKAIPGANRYQLSAGGGHFLEYTRDIVGATELRFDANISAGTHVRWIVRAYRTASPYDEVIAEFEAVQLFIVAE